ncbi:MAG TPA: ATP-binding protein, partial [Phycisphaerae bacterium]
DEIWGCAREQFYEASGSGHSFLRSVHALDRKRVAAAIQRQLAGEPTDTEYRIVRPDGSTRWIWDRAFPVRDEQGRVYRSTGIAEDVSERKRAEAVRTRRVRHATLRADVSSALATAATSTRGVLQNCAEAIVRNLAVSFARIWTLDAAGTTLELQASAGLYTHLDGPHSRVPVGQLKIGRIAATRRPLLTNDVANDPHISDPEWARAAGMVAFAGYPLLVDERLIGVLAMFSRHVLSDETLSDLGGVADVIAQGLERRRAEEQLRDLNATLEQRIQQRTAQLEDVNRELESFAYSVSHDLRAPLRHMNGFAELLQKRARGKLDDDSARYVRTIATVARRAGSLVDELLAFSRIGRTEPRRTTVPMRPLVEEVREELSTEMEGRRFEWTIGDLPAVEADASLMRLVVQNLLSNAIKYTRGRDPAVIEVGSQKGPDEIVFFVRDNGVGYDMKYADKLFGVFQRLHSEQEFEGTGIGLANVRRIVQLHGGRTWAEGAVDQGATFYFSLPRQPCTADVHV